jgi:uracil-DNA glycosylase
MYKEGLSPFLHLLKETSWCSFFEGTLPIIKKIDEKLIADYNDNITIYPKPNEVFNAMLYSPLADMKVCIIGQDCYHTPGAAMGLAFSHNDNYKKIQPSLKNIYKELIAEGYKVNTKSGNLVKWAEQGVFLINTALTVKKDEANSHCEYWREFTIELFKYISKECNHLVVIMWGNQAKSYKKYFDKTKHQFIISAHPSPLSATRGFFGSKPFTQTNKYLELWNMNPIDWNLI